MFIFITENHYLPSERIVFIAPPKTAASKKIISAAKEDGRIFNLLGGKVKVRCIAILNTGHVCLIPLTPAAFIGRLNEGLGALPECNPQRGREYFDETVVDDEDLSLTLDTDIELEDLGPISG